MQFVMQSDDGMGGAVAASPDSPDNSKAENKLAPDSFLSAMKYNLWKNIRNTRLIFVWIIDKTSGVMQGRLEHLWQNEGQNTE